MFTGIVEEVGTVREIAFPDGPESDAVLTVHGPLATSDAALGDSIAVNGVCLTVTSVSPDGAFTADVMPESLRRTALGDLRPGSPVNLERAVRADTRLGGHIVQGHVDGVGSLVSRAPGERWDDLVLSAPPGLTRYVAEKGSITVSGVSLTVTHVDDTSFGVSLIPTTLEATILGSLAPGDRVNLEVDVLAKYVERLLATGATGPVGDPGTSAAQE
ncbi:riboflavin synthase [Oerskovia turbata]|uniref:Riboflavin synthase n=1 Tax=Oerskovia turbata TaxID=1713 RepID=A0A4Q1KZH2_9CELL|nr:riboflavin synthase [Oerskovia turbata]RXR24827.1 riboflavin synthase [Oerskovia turbata]RXR34969.1 riboflavin synthase [Oerskovia turbata]TGJ97029.1 riboflavin synthase [Actinotalea fermentans ATCC 43279 = JCM 9966 = DSM 3133]